MIENMNLHQTEMDDAINKIIKELMEKFYDQLERVVLKKLNHMGHKFKNRNEFLDFCKQRVSTAQFRDLNIVYLDFNHETKEGVVLTTYYNKTEMSESNGKITVTIG